MNTERKEEKITSVFFCVLYIFQSMTKKKVMKQSFILLTKSSLQVNLPLVAPVTQVRYRWKGVHTFNYYRSLEFEAMKEPPWSLSVLWIQQHECLCTCRLLSDTGAFHSLHPSYICSIFCEIIACVGISYTFGLSNINQLAKTTKCKVKEI